MLEEIDEKARKMEQLRVLYPRRAVELAIDVIEASERVEYPRHLPLALIIRGNHARRLGAFEDAVRDFDHAANLARELGDRAMEGRALNGRGLTEEYSAHFRTAKPYFEQALKIARETGDTPAEALSLTNLADVEHLWGHDEQAMRYAREAYDVAKGSEAELIPLYHLATLIAQGGEWQKGMAMLEEMLLLSEHYVTERERHEMEITELKASQLEKDLANSAVHLAAQTELLGNFREELRRIVRDFDEPIEALKKIKEKLKTLPCESIDWTKFEKEFLSVHPEFVRTLKERFSLLTRQEVKMCQLARLGLKNYEMSRLLCLSERTIESHRLNLRKKLGLKTEESLSKFLETI